MKDKIVESLKNIEIHADVLMEIPANEQNIGAIQSVVSIALLEVKRCLEAMHDEVNSVLSPHHPSLPIVSAGKPGEP